MDVFPYEEEHTKVRTILEKFVEINGIELDILLVNQYIRLECLFYKEVLGV